MKLILVMSNGNEIEVESFEDTIEDFMYMNIEQQANDFIRIGDVFVRHVEIQAIKPA